MVLSSSSYIFFFFNDTATTEIYTLSLHDALPIFRPLDRGEHIRPHREQRGSTGNLELQQRLPRVHRADQDRKSTRLNSSHGYISYAVFCLKKKNRSQAKLATLPQPNSHVHTAPRR